MKTTVGAVDPKVIGERIRDLRRRAGLNQQEMAEMLGIRQSTLSDYENGRLGISLDQAAHVCKKFMVKLDWLCYGDK